MFSVLAQFNSFSNSKQGPLVPNGYKSCRLRYDSKVNIDFFLLSSTDERWISTVAFHKLSTHSLVSFLIQLCQLAFFHCAVLEISSLVRREDILAEFLRVQPSVLGPVIRQYSMVKAIFTSQWLRNEVKGRKLWSPSTSFKVKLPATFLPLGGLCLLNGPPFTNIPMTDDQTFNTRALRGLSKSHPEHNLRIFTLLFKGSFLIVPKWHHRYSWFLRPGLSKRK